MPYAVHLPRIVGRIQIGAGTLPPVVLACSVAWLGLVATWKGLQYLLGERAGVGAPNTRYVRAVGPTVRRGLPSAGSLLSTVIGPAGNVNRVETIN